MKLPSTHSTWSDFTSSDAGGTYVEWYSEDENGEQPMVQRWYVTPEYPAPDEPPADGWHPLTFDDGPDRTDPGYWLDNF